MRIAITGSIAYDYIMRFPGEFSEVLLADKLENISVSFLVDEMTRHRGGIAPNIAYTLALLGERPTVVGTAGEDFDEYRRWLESAGVDTSGIRQIEGVFTASFFVSTDRVNNQIAMFYSGAMAHAKELSLMEAVGETVDLVVVSPNDPAAMRNYIKECKDRGIPYIYDPSQQVARVGGDELLEGVDGAWLLVVNDYELEALKKKTGRTHDDLAALAEIIVVTRGKDGSDIYLPDGTIHIPVVPPTHIADPTGVGDGFRGGLLKGIAMGWPWEISGRLGALAATYVLEQRGTQTHRYSPAEFIARFRKHFDDNGLLDEMGQ
jgi:adenosine kinase